jgi:hypothetical protein
MAEQRSPLAEKRIDTTVSTPNGTDPVIPLRPTSYGEPVISDDQAQLTSVRQALSLGEHRLQLALPGEM